MASSTTAADSTAPSSPDNQPDNKVKIAVVQAGINPQAEGPVPPIKLERTKRHRPETQGRHHLDGPTSPDTATGDFFICIGDQPELDFGGKRNPDGQGFAAFGKVVKGMDVVKMIKPRFRQRPGADSADQDPLGAAAADSDAGRPPRPAAAMRGP